MSSFKADEEMYNFFSKRYFVREEGYEDIFENSCCSVGPDMFVTVLSYVDKSKTPGSPLCFLTPTNHGLFEMQEELREEVNYKLEGYEKIGRRAWELKMFNTSHEEHVHISMELLRKGYIDPTLIGPKGEGRKIGKKPRLICQKSVVENLAARVVIQDHLIEEQSRDELPTATSLDLTTQEETERRRLYISRSCEDGYASTSDVEGWEYSMNENDRWVVCFKELICMNLVKWKDGDFEIRYENRRHAYAVIGYHFCMIHRVVQLPSGLLVVTPAGQMSSGELGTFSENSSARAWLCELVSKDNTGDSCKFIMCGGDDAIDSNPDLRQYYLNYGKVITDYAVTKDSYNFCSTTFSPEGSYQDNIAKSTFSVIVKGFFDPESRCSYDLNFRLHPRYREFISCIENLPMAPPA